MSITYGEFRFWADLTLPPVSLILNSFLVSTYIGVSILILETGRFYGELNSRLCLSRSSSGDTISSLFLNLVLLLSSSNMRLADYILVSLLLPLSLFFSLALLLLFVWVSSKLDVCLAAIAGLCSSCCPRWPKGLRSLSSSKTTSWS